MTIFTDEAWRHMGNPEHVVWCPHCQCTTLPSRTGICLFCEAKITRRRWAFPANPVNDRPGPSGRVR